MTPDIQSALQQLIAFNGLVFGLTLAARGLWGRRLNPAVPAMAVTLSSLMILNLAHDRMGNTALTEMRFVVPLLVGPMFLLHVRLEGGGFPPGLRTLVAHLLPAALLTAVVLAGWSPYGLLSMLIPLHIGGYLAASAWLASRGGARFWTWLLLGLGAAAIALNIIAILLGAAPGEAGRAFENLIFAVLLALVCALVVVGFSDPAGLLRVAVAQVTGKAPDPDDAAELAALAGRIEALLSPDGPHLDPGFRLSLLARRLGEPERRVSRAINAGFGLSVPDYLNLRRVEAVRRRLADPDEDATLLEIAMDCGFNSKATFNRAFARHTGQTPSQAREAGQGEIATGASHFTI